MQIEEQALLLALDYVAKHGDSIESPRAANLADELRTQRRYVDSIIGAASVNEDAEVASSTSPPAEPPPVVETSGLDGGGSAAQSSVASGE